MAIVNITEDSFSDGGLYIDLPSAINHASLCIKQGAHILDIGAQSTRPGASEVGPEIEIKRLVPLISLILITSVLIWMYVLADRDAAEDTAIRVCFVATSAVIVVVVLELDEAVVFDTVELL